MPAFMSLPRDFKGYGAHPPHPHWPGEARIALQVVVNYEEGAESSIDEGDPASEFYLAEVVGIPPLPGQRHLGVESAFEYGSRAGFWRLYRILTDAGIPATVFANGRALERNPEAAHAMARAGWEVAGHGQRWIDYNGMPEDEERAHFARTLKIFESLGLPAPQGWYTGRISPNTIDIAARTPGIRYSSDVYADDLPYWINGPDGPFLMIPYAMDSNDMRYCSLTGFTEGEQFFTYLKDSFDQLYDEGATSPKMMNIGLHGRISGRAGRAAALRRFLDYARAKEGVWFARRCDIADHWHATHPAGA